MNFLNLLSRLIISFSVLLYCLLPTSVFAANDTGKPKNVRIVVGGDHSYPPYEFLNGKGEPDGFNVEITRAIAEAMGMKVEIILGGWSLMRNALETGSIDALQGIVYSKERAKLYDYSPPHSVVHNSIWVRSGAPKVDSLDSLTGKSVVVQKEGIIHDFLRESGLEFDFILTQTHGEALQLLIEGKYDYAVVAKVPGQFYIKETGNENKVYVTVPVTSHRYGYAVMKGQEELLGRFTEGLTVLKKTGQYQDIYDKWLGALEPKGFSANTILQYGAAIIIPLLLGLAASILWSRTLKKQVGVRTAALEKEMTKHKQALEELKLRQRQLIQADKLASLGILVSGVAHEINNPNGLILMNLPAIRDTFQDALPVLEEYYKENPEFTLGGLGYESMRDEIPEMIIEMQSSGVKIKRIVEDLKDFARKDSSAMDENMNVNEVVEAAIRLTENSIRKSTDHFSVKYVENIPNVKGNNQRIEQVIVNLILNACQSLSSLKKKIIVQTGIQASEIFIKIQDEGVGITPENLDHLTDPFFTTKRELGGTGLGLSISDGIAKKHGGRLEFTSKINEGTAVSLILPMQKI